jgi:hypothetical protein
VHRDIAALAPGDRVFVVGRHIQTAAGRRIGRLANKIELRFDAAVPATVSGILVRTREQSGSSYAANLRVDRWEAVLVELVVPGSRQE